MSPQRTPEKDPAVLLGEMLREVRLAAGFRSQEAIAKEMGTDRTNANKAETGAYPPTEAVLAAWLRACGVDGLLHKMFVGLWKLARASHGADPVKVWFSGYVEAEAAAHTLRIWQPLIIHGLFQTPEYARELFAVMGMDDDSIQDQIELRIGRQSILTRSPLPSIVALLDESVLNRLIGSPEVMRQQLARILELSRRIVVQVVPSRVGANAGLGGAITLAAGTGTPEVLAAEAMVEDQVTHDISTVLRASATFDTIRGDALSRADSRDLIQEALERCIS